MALTLNQLVGFESGGLEEATGGTSGTPDATEAVIVRSGDRSLLLGTIGDRYVINLFDEVSDAGTGHVFGFGIYLATLPGTSLEFGRVRDSSDTFIGSLKLNASDKMEWRQQDGTVQITSDIDIVAGRWYYIEIYFVDSATGASEMFINGDSQGTDPSGDYNSGTALDNFEFVEFNSPVDVYFDDFYWLSGATAASDRLGPGASVLGYSNSAQSVSPDFDSSGTAGGDNLDAGSGSETGWANSGRVPWSDSNWAGYHTSSAVSGCVAYNDAGSGNAGPLSGNQIVSGTIKGAKFAWRADRSGGGSTTQEFVYGKYDGAGDMDDAPQVDSVTLSQGTLLNFFRLTEAAGLVPTASEDFVMGFANDGGRDFDCYEMQAFLLHVSSTNITDLSDGLMPEYPSHGLTVEV